jgi:PAS domain S-box-containing protein
MRPTGSSTEIAPRSDDQAEPYLAALLEATGEAIVCSAPDGRITHWNHGAERVYGYTAAEAQGRPLSMLAPPELLAEQSALVARIKHGETVPPFETTRLTRSGERIVVRLSITALRDRHGKVTGAMAVVQNISERKKLAAEAAQLRLAIDAAPNGIVMINDQGRIVMVNAQMERLFGYSHAEMIGQTIELLIPERYRSAHPGKRAAYFSSPEVRAMGHGRDLFARRKDGTEFPVEVGLNPAHTPEGTFVLGAVIDISTRKKMEEALAAMHTDLQRHAQKLEVMVAERTAHLQQTIAELEGVSYSLSHDLRGPLRTIQGFMQLVLDDAGERLHAEEKDLMAKAMKAAHRLDRLIQDVLTYTRVSRQTVALEHVDVERLLRQIIDERPELRSPNAELVIDTPLHAVLGHEASLTQVITNLLENAVKFMPPDRTPRVHISSRVDGDQVELCFQDNGIGIPEDAQPRLFAIFQRVHDDKRYPGTGIGLAIVRKAVERMQGTVTLQSELNVGSRFCVRLPKG